jgi:integrase
LLDQAGYEYRKFHAPRHTFASLLVSANPPTPLIAIKEQMGHHSMQMTVDIYGKFINSGQGITFILDSPQWHLMTPTKKKRRRQEPNIIKNIY